MKIKKGVVNWCIDAFLSWALSKRDIYVEVAHDTTLLGDWTDSVRVVHAHSDGAGSRIVVFAQRGDITD